MNKHSCPVCGFPGLKEQPRSDAGGGSYEICPSCGFQFGVSDDDAGETYAAWRAKWIASGCKWSSKGIERPRNWDAERQLAGVEVRPEREGRKGGGHRAAEKSPRRSPK